MLAGLQCKWSFYDAKTTKDDTTQVRNPMANEESEQSEDKVEAIAEGDEDGDQSVLVSILTFDFHELIFGGKDFTAQSAWIVVLLETLIIAAACYILAEAVMLSAKALGVQPYFTAVILGAAASSVPVKMQPCSQPCYSSDCWRRQDTYISYKDAMKGDYDDAIANAIGSNIFDICFALGFPLMLYGLIYGDVSMLPAADGGGTGLDGGNDVSEIQSLRILLIFCSVLMMSVFLLTKV
jgi:cation:H+ antiporter